MPQITYQLFAQEEKKLKTCLLSQTLTMIKDQSFKSSSQDISI